MMEVLGTFLWMIVMPTVMIGVGITFVGFIILAFLEESDW